jgi:hypothetical protein
MPQNQPAPKVAFRVLAAVVAGVVVMVVLSVELARQPLATAPVAHRSTNGAAFLGLMGGWMPPDRSRLHVCDEPW